MLEPMHSFDETATARILTEEMHSLYLFSFLLAADNDRLPYVLGHTITSSCACAAL